TCSSTSPAIDTARNVVAVPILKIDDPLYAEAARTSGKVGLICTTPSTVEPSQALLQAHARATGQSVTARCVLEPEAFKALVGGDRERHDALIVAAADVL